MTTTIHLTPAAIDLVDETGCDPEGDVRDLLDGSQTRETLIAYCLDGAAEDRVEGWREYVAAVVEEADRRRAARAAAASAADAARAAAYAADAARAAAYDALEAADDVSALEAADDADDVADAARARAHVIARMCRRPAAAPPAAAAAAPPTPAPPPTSPTPPTPPPAISTAIPAASLPPTSSHPTATPNCRAQLLAECLDGASSDRIDGWCDYVAAIAEAAAHT